MDMRARLNKAAEFDPATTAVLAIDTHRGHLDPEVATMPVTAKTAASVVGASERLLAAVRAHGIPTIYLVMHNRELGGQSENLRNPFWRTVEGVREQLTPELASTIKGHNLTGSVGREIMPTMAPVDGDYVVDSKHRLSSFLDTDLDSTLRVLGTETLLLIGINTNTCVMCAAFEAFNRDYGVVVVSDCVDSMYGDDLHEFGLENVARCIGWVMDADEVSTKLAAGREAQAAPVSEPAAV